MADLKCFILKDKQVIYTRIFVKFYHWRNRGQIYKIYVIIKLEKIYALTRKNPYNLGTYQIIEISFVPCNTYRISKAPDKIVFYINNHIN